MGVSRWGLGDGLEGGGEEGGGKR